MSPPLKRILNSRCISVSLGQGQPTGKSVSLIWLCYSMVCSPPVHPWNSPGKNTGVGSHSLPQGIFLTQGSNLGLWHYRQILYHLSHQGSPSIRVFSNESALWIGDQSIGASASALVLPMNIQDWFPLRLTGLISLQSKGLSSIFSNTTVQKHQFFSTQPYLWSNSHIRSWLLEKL